MRSLFFLLFPVFTINAVSLSPGHTNRDLNAHLGVGDLPKEDRQFVLESPGDHTQCTSNGNGQEHPVSDPMAPLSEALVFMQAHPKIRLENRPYNGIPYGEVLGKCNPADGNRWDVFLPGSAGAGDGHFLQFSQNDTDNLYTVEEVIGVYLLDNNNHKIAISIEEEPCNNEKVSQGIALFHAAYSGKLAQYHRELHPQYCPLDRLNFTTTRTTCT